MLRAKEAGLVCMCSFKSPCAACVDILHMSMRGCVHVRMQGLVRLDPDNKVVLLASRVSDSSVIDPGTYIR